MSHCTTEYVTLAPAYTAPRHTHSHTHGRTDGHAHRHTTDHGQELKLAHKVPNPFLGSIGHNSSGKWPKDTERDALTLELNWIW